MSRQVPESSRSRLEREIPVQVLLAFVGLGDSLVCLLGLDWLGVALSRSTEACQKVEAASSVQGHSLSFSCQTLPLWGPVCVSRGQLQKLALKTCCFLEGRGRGEMGAANKLCRAHLWAKDTGGRDSGR